MCMYIHIPYVCVSVCSIRAGLPSGCWCMCVYVCIYVHIEFIDAFCPLYFIYRMHYGGDYNIDKIYKLYVFVVEMNVGVLDFKL